MHGKKSRQYSLNYLLLHLHTGVWFILLRVFVFGSYKSPPIPWSRPLYPATALVNKLAYGARIFNLFDAVEGKKVNINRVPGYTRLKTTMWLFSYSHPDMGQDRDEYVQILYKTLHWRSGRHTSGNRW